jgi:tight adherence protein B
MFDRRQKRLRLIIAQSTAARLPHMATASDADRRKAIQAKLREVEAKRSGQNRYRLGSALAQAGLAWTPAQFVAGSVALGVVSGLIGLQASPIVGVLAIIAGGLGVPQFVLRHKAKRRLARFVALFAEALDVIIRGVRSGLPLGECLHVIAREVADPVGGEFRMVTEGVRLGMTMEESLRRMALRVPTPEVKFFAIVIGIQQQTGGNLAETLAKLSDVLRSRKRMRDKVSAVSGEAKASATIIGSLPLVVSALLGIVSPDYITLLFTSSTGNWILAGSAMIMSIGVVVMRGMINFDI